jgi:hypothetical protein
MNNKSSDLQTEKLGQFLECMVPNLVGFCLNSYLGVASSVIILLWHWQAEINPDRPQRPLLFCLSAIALLLLLNPSDRVSTSPRGITSPPVTLQCLNSPSSSHNIKNRVSPK